MTRRATSFDLALPPRATGMAANRWLCDAIRTEILGGRLRPGGRLPATRDLAARYALSRGTVVAAFDQLRSEGYLATAVGSGTFVNRVLPDELLHAARSSRRRSAGAHPQRSLSDYAKRLQLFPGFGPAPLRAFRSDQPALDLFPVALWSQVAHRRLRRVTTKQLLECEPLGYRPLREAIASYLGASRGVQCTAEQVVIVSGSQEALDLAGRMLLDPGDGVCHENPGYRGATMVFESLGAKLHDMRVDDEGMVIPPAQLKHVRLAYVTPGRQFPIGVVMSPRRRLELLQWARAAGALIFEDDYDSEYRYAGRPVPALQSLDAHGVVLFSGTFSKVLFPSMRLGYLVLPPDLVERFAAAKSLTSRHVPVLEQAVLCDFITEGHFGRHIRRMREVYDERCSVLLESAREKLGGLVEIPHVEAGLQTAGWLPEGIDGHAVEQAAARFHVEVTPLSQYYRGPRPKRDGLQIGFAAVDATEIRRGVIALARVLKNMTAGAGTGAGRQRN